MNRLPWLMARRSVSIVMIGAVIASGLSVAPRQVVADVRPTGVFEEAACPFGLPDGIVEDQDVTCGYLTVPERHEHPDGPSIRLAVAILEQTGRSETSPPLIMLNGGPGQGSDGLLSVFVPGPEGVLAELREDRVVVLVDQRGTGRSEPSLLCPGDTVDAPDFDNPKLPAGDPVEVPTDIEGQNAFYRACLDDWIASGVDIGAYTSAQNAADIAALRVALGYDEVDLLGVSYGTRLALTIMRDHPDGIRAVVLGSVLPLEVDAYAEQTVAFDESLRAVFAGCEADATCAALLPDPEASFVAVLSMLDASPLSLTYTSLVTGEPVDLEVDGAVFMTATYLAMYVGPLVGYIPALIASVETGSTDVLAALAPVAELIAGGIATGMLLAVNCQEELSFTSWADIVDVAEEADVLAPLQTEAYMMTSGAGLARTCEELDLGSAPAIENEPVTSDIPTLIISGEYDPITPPRHGDLVAANLENSTHVVITGVSHDPISSSVDCAVPMVVAFLADPDKRVRQGCANDLEVDFSPGF